jgi:hypothetical protein
VGEQLRIDTGKSALTLAELGGTLPGMARLMAEISPRMGTCYHAAKAGNWPLARYMLLAAVDIMQTAMVLRPKYRDDMTEFIAAHCGAVLDAINARDATAFGTAFDRLVDAANASHEAYDHPYIRWRVPAAAPEHLDLAHDGTVDAR